MVRRKEGTKIELPTAPGWMVTYGDMMGLILCFFVIIVSFSQIEVSKFKAAIGSLRGALQPWNPDPTGSSMIMTPTIKFGLSREVDEAIDQIVEAVQKEGMQQKIEVQQTGSGVKIIFSDPVLFEVGSDELKLSVLSIIEKLARLALKLNPKEIIVEGHTDDTPISTDRFPSNWELSAARALSVLKFFQSQGFPPEKLAAVGYGEYRPRLKVPSTASSEEKAINRRVEVFIKTEQARPGLFSNLDGGGDGWGD